MGRRKLVCSCTVVIGLKPPSWVHHGQHHRVSAAAIMVWPHSTPPHVHMQRHDRQAQRHLAGLAASTRSPAAHPGRHQVGQHGLQGRQIEQRGGGHAVAPGGVQGC
jgi:hypothetical protein